MSMINRSFSRKGMGTRGVPWSRRWPPMFLRNCLVSSRIDGPTGGIGP